MLFTTAALLTACGGSAGTGSGPVDDAIAKAEEAVKIEESASLGKLPFLCSQQKEARNNLDSYYKDEYSKVEDKEQLSKLGDERKADYEKLTEYYSEKIKAEAKALDGKTIPVEFDKDFLSAATAKLVYDDGESYGSCLKIAIELTPATNFVMATALLQDAQGQTIKELALSSMVTMLWPAICRKVFAMHHLVTISRPACSLTLPSVQAVTRNSRRLS